MSKRTCEVCGDPAPEILFYEDETEYIDLCTKHFSERDTRGEKTMSTAETTSVKDVPGEWTFKHLSDSSLSSTNTREIRSYVNGSLLGFRPLEYFVATIFEDCGQWRWSAWGPGSYHTARVERGTARDKEHARSQADAALIELGWPL